jgi:SAM-dependent methyltransferase
MTEPLEPTPSQGGGNALSRVREAYRERDAAMPWDDRLNNVYHPRHPLGHTFRRHNQDLLVDALNRLDIELRELRILDVGSGYGHWLRHLIELGADPSRLAGVEPTSERVRVAARANPRPAWIQADGGAMPFADASFDLVLQVVVLSSVLDDGMRRAIASEMNRVLRPGGHLFWIDSRRGQRNRLVGFSRTAVQDLFPGWRIVHARGAHPRHFRWLGGRLRSIGELLFALAPIGCEASLYVLRKETGRSVG